MSSSRLRLLVFSVKRGSFQLYFSCIKHSLRVKIEMRIARPIMSRKDHEGPMETLDIDGTFD